MNKIENNKKQLQMIISSIDFIRDNVYPLLHKISTLDYNEYSSEIAYLGKGIRKQMIESMGDLHYYKDLYEDELNYDESNI
jgi:hypothetical protein